MFSRIFIRTRVNLCTAVKKRVFCWWSESRIQRVTYCLQGQNPTVLSLSGLIRIAPNGINICPTTNPKPLCGLEERNVSHRCTSASDDQFHHCFLVLENEQQSIMMRQFCVRSDASHFSQTWEVPTSCGFWDAAHTVNTTHRVSLC